jgi:phage baseplate assembly protein V
MDAHHSPTQIAGDLLRFGCIKTVDAARGTCTVETGDLITPPLPWVTMRAGDLASWSAPSEGEQCLLICPEGDTEFGVVLLGLYCAAHPQPETDSQAHCLAFSDGARLSYNVASHALAAILPGGGTVRLVADGGIKITGDVEITGNVKTSGNIAASGNVSADGDVTAAGVSLKDHLHKSVKTGTDLSGKPQQ